MTDARMDGKVADMRTKRLLVWGVILEMFLSPVCRAADENYNLGLSTSTEHALDARGNEYTSGLGSGAVLMRVDLWGSVQKTGVHHIPPRTSLITLLSYAGGPLTTAETDNITIRRTVDGKPVNIKVNLDTILSTAGAPSPVLEPNDVVVVPALKPIVSNNTIILATLVASVLSIALAAIVIRQEIKN